MRWVKDQKTEANFRSLGCPLTAERVKKSDIDRAEGLRRQPRLQEKLDDDYVMQLALGMEQPDAAFPMIVLFKAAHGKFYWALAGNHRLGAHDLKFSEEEYIDAYVTTIIDPMLLDVVPRVVNGWEGRGLSREERVLQARYFIEHHSMRAEEAAKLMGLPNAESIYLSRRVDEIKAKIADVPRVSGLSKTILVQMSPLQANINVLKATAGFLCKNKVKGEDAKRMVEDVKAQNTELQQMSEIAKWEKMIQDRNGEAPPKVKVKGKTAKPAVKISLEVRRQFLKLLTSLAKMVSQRPTLEQLQCTTDADKDLLYRSFWTIYKGLDPVVKQIQIREGGAK